MKLKKRAAALAATAALTLGSVVAIASPAYAAPTCTSTYVGGNWAGLGGGYRFSCYNSTNGGVWLSIGCANTFTSRNRYIRYEHRPIGYPWSLGHTMYCSGFESPGLPSYGPL